MTLAIAADELTLLQALSDRFPSSDAASAEIAALEATLGLPKESVHIVSDVHGEYKKLRHVINNASGHLRPLIASLFEGRLSEAEARDLLALIYYPQEMIAYRTPLFLIDEERISWVQKTLRLQFDVIRSLAGVQRRSTVTALFPETFRELFNELLTEPGLDRKSYINTMLQSLGKSGRDLVAVRSASHLIRNLSVDEVIVAGDLGDRGPRIDRVIDFLMQQPRVSITWGNHDVSWMGACLGNDALIATVLRISLRYRRLSQLEEGYGLIMTPLEKLARVAYADDPAERFRTKGSGLRDDLLMARMQKAVSILQFKLEGQLIDRHPEWEMEPRKLLHLVDRKNGTIEINGQSHPLLDSSFPTMSDADPYALSEEERVCVERLRTSFLTSARLWNHMSYIVRNGAMWLRRDDALIFHGCVPVNEAGEPLELQVDGRTLSGRPLFDALDSVVRRSFRENATTRQRDTDWLWYLWTGPRSPLFGKDKMGTLETYYIADKEAAKEKKNPYFSLINDASFCRRVLAEFGMPDSGIIVNGHVPVKVEKGEMPLKKGGNAVTIDGAFSEAYGDRGYTLILEPERIAIAEHHHFESIQEAITTGADIVPTVTTIREINPPRLVADTEEGEQVRRMITELGRLVVAYEEGVLKEHITPPPGNTSPSR